MQPIPIIPVYADTIVRHIPCFYMVAVGQPRGPYRDSVRTDAFWVIRSEHLDGVALSRRDNPPSSLPAGTDSGSRDA